MPASKLQLLLQDFQETANSIEVRQYSGRGMYGKQCLAIEGDFSACQEALAYVIAALHEDLIVELDEAHDAEKPYEPSVDFEDFVQKTLKYSQDQMGLDVVFYWPRVEYVDTDDGERHFAEDTFGDG